MDYTVTCPHCQAVMRIMNVQIGQTATCPHCKKRFLASLPGPAGAHVGKLFSFICTQCSSRLEAFSGMVGQPGRCPTCGVEFRIPAPFGKGERVGGTEPELEYRQPVHAYAAAGAKAPQILRLPDGTQVIECPRCHTRNGVARNNCSRCTMPFTLEGAEGSTATRASGLATASLVLGIIGLPTSCLLVPPLLALIFGVLSMRGSSGEDPAPARGYSIAGIVLGVLGLVIFALVVKYYV